MLSPHMLSKIWEGAIYTVRPSDAEAFETTGSVK